MPDPKLGEDSLIQQISEFSCPKNPDVEHFLKKNAIEFTKKSQSVTYFVFSLRSMDENVRILQFLDLIKDVDVYSEEAGDALKKRMMEIMKKMNVTFSALEPYLSYYPEKIYKNMYETGMLAGVSA